MGCRSGPAEIPRRWVFKSPSSPTRLLTLALRSFSRINLLDHKRPSDVGGLQR
jgi:hypothetical protein